VKALQWLLTRSFSGKPLAVKRVVSNRGKKTPGVDKAIWETPKQKMEAVQNLRRHGYKALPLRRVYIPKKNKKKMRPLGIPMVASYCRRCNMKQPSERPACVLRQISSGSAHL
jgi:RNA-directed DNA polymerase